MQIDANDITRALTTLFESGDVFEIRTLDTRLPSDYINKKPRTLSGYFDTAHIPQLCQELGRLETASGVYFTLNPVNSDLLARCAYRLQEPKATTADKDITKRRWLPLDFDAERPSGISSSDDEHQKALILAAHTAEKLSAKFGVHPVRLDSGNGAHLLFRIDLPNDPEATALVKDVLETLSGEFSTDGVKLDSVNFNAARIWKLSGTYARKGDSIPTRPHRLARVLAIPENLQPVSKEALQEVAKANQQTPPTQPKTASPSAPSETATRKFDGAEWVTTHFPEARRQAYQGGSKWILKECPFNPEHNRGEAIIIQTADGKMGFHCQHDSCSGYHWRELREKIEPGCYDPKEEVSNVDITAILTNSNTKTDAKTAAEASKTPADAKKPTTPTETGTEKKKPAKGNIIQKARAAQAENQRLTHVSGICHASRLDGGTEAAVRLMAGLGITERICQRMKIGKHPNTEAAVIPHEINGDLQGYSLITSTGSSDTSHARGLPFHIDVLKASEQDKRAAYPHDSNTEVLADTRGVVFAVDTILDALAIEELNFPAIVCNMTAPELHDYLKDSSITARAIFYLGSMDFGGESGFIANYGTATRQEIIEGRGLDYGEDTPRRECYEWYRNDPEGLREYLTVMINDYDCFAHARQKEYETLTTPEGFSKELEKEIHDGRKLVKTGFGKLDDALDGGFGHEFVIIGAQSGMGKTTFCLQMAEQMTNINCRDVLYFCLEQDKKEMAAKGIARHAFQLKHIEISAKNVLSGYAGFGEDSQEQGAIDSGRAAYCEAAKRMHFIECRNGEAFGAKQIRKKVAEHRQKTGASPIVFVDYLQLLQDEEMQKAKATDREILEANIRGLTSIARSFGTTVVAISAFNRSATHSNADMDAFNGTSKIEFSADYLLALQPDIEFLMLHVVLDGFNRSIYDRDKDELNIEGFKAHFNPRLKGTAPGGVLPMAIKILKQRLSGSGAPVRFVYKPKVDTFIDQTFHDASIGQAAFYPDEWDEKQQAWTDPNKRIFPEVDWHLLDRGEMGDREEAYKKAVCKITGETYKPPKSDGNSGNGTSNSNSGNGKKKKEKKEDFILKE